MNIKQILSNRFAKQVGIVLALGCPTAILSRSCEQQVINKLKTEVYAKDSLRYKEIEKQAEDMGIYAQKLYWREANEKIDDSLRMDSVIKKAYFEGAQMVRDSIRKERSVKK